MSSERAAIRNRWYKFADDARSKSLTGQLGGNNGTPVDEVVSAFTESELSRLQQELELAKRDCMGILQNESDLRMLEAIGFTRAREGNVTTWHNERAESAERELKALREQMRQAGPGCADCRDAAVSASPAAPQDEREKWNNEDLQREVWDAALQDERERGVASPAASTTPTIRLEVFQHDWIPGFAAFHDDGRINETAKAHVVLNLGSLIAAVKEGDLDNRDLPYMIAESLMHEAIHALEAWAGVEFSEERVECLLEEYRKKYERATIWEYTGLEPEATQGDAPAQPDLSAIAEVLRAGLQELTKHYYPEPFLEQFRSAISACGAASSGSGEANG